MQQSSNRPLKDQDTRRWLKVYNPSDKAIPPYGTFVVYGKVFTGKY